MIVSPDKFSNKQGKAILTDTADDGKITFEVSPKSLNTVGMYVSTNKLSSVVAYPMVFNAILLYSSVHLVAIGVEYGIRSKTRGHKTNDGFLVSFDEHLAGYGAALAAQNAYNRRFCSAVTLGSASSSYVARFVLPLTTNECFICFADAGEWCGYVCRHADTHVVEHTLHPAVWKCSLLNNSTYSSAFEERLDAMLPLQSG